MLDQETQLASGIVGILFLVVFLCLMCTVVIYISLKYYQKNQNHPDIPLENMWKNWTKLSIKEIHVWAYSWKIGPLNLRMIGVLSSMFSSS